MKTNELNFPPVEVENIQDIIGIGVDIVETDRFIWEGDLRNKRALNRMFTKCELESAVDRRDTKQFLAGRFALKEAVIKAFSSSNVSLLNISSIEIQQETDGGPAVSLPDSLSGDHDVFASISHETAYAIGFTIVMKRTSPEPNGE